MSTLDSVQFLPITISECEKLQTAKRWKIPHIRRFPLRECAPPRPFPFCRDLVQSDQRVAHQILICIINYLINNKNRENEPSSALDI